VIDLFVKVRGTPLKILLLIALLRRIPKNHPKRPLIEKELHRRSAGFWGELEVDKKLKRIDQSRYSILCDLRLPNGDDTFFQIDTLIISAQFILIIESKNISGTLYFDLVNHQFYRTNDDGSREVFSDPVSQARLHVQQLRDWLQKNKFTNTPIEFLVASANPHSLFHITPQNHPYAQKICNISSLTWEIDELGDRYNKDILTEKEIRKLCNSLKKAHTPLQPSDILQQYGIDQFELLTGVHCPDCEYLPLTYKVGKWCCPRCKKRYKDAHFPAVDDYFLLVSPTITNAEFRRFVHMKNPDIARRQLIGMNLKSAGTTKGKVYQRV
jgi:hypothetical protein